MYKKPRTTKMCQYSRQLRMRMPWGLLGNQRRKKCSKEAKMLSLVFLTISKNLNWSCKRRFLACLIKKFDQAMCGVWWVCCVGESHDWESKFKSLNFGLGLSRAHSLTFLDKAKYGDSFKINNTTTKPLVWKIYEIIWEAQ